MNEVLTRDVNGRRFDSGQVHHFHEIYNIIHHTTMRLTKYQKARLLEFEWDLINNGTDDDTCWINIDNQDKHMFDNVKSILNLDTHVESVNLLVVAVQLNPDK